MEINLSIENDPLKIELSKEAELKGVSLEELIADILQEYVNTESVKNII